MKSLAATACLALFPAFAAAENSVNNNDNIEDMLFREVAVASIKPVAVRESPGLITVITADDIKKSGARDLLDVLRTVPGFNFGHDSNGIVGFTKDSKILMLVDGMQINDMFYGALNFGNEFPVDIIKRIEIIRGPGSVIYGSMAEFGVINIITKEASDIKGAAASAIYGTTAKAMGNADVTASYGKQISEDASVVGSLFYGKGNRSDHYQTDMYGNNSDMAGNSHLNPFNALLKADYGNLHAVGMIKNQQTTIQDYFGSAVGRQLPFNSESSYFKANYKIKAADNLVITPEFNFMRQSPWNVPDSSAPYYNSKTADRYQESVQVSYDPTSGLNMILGLEHYNDWARDNIKPGNVNYYNDAAFLQIMSRNDIADITLGGRYDNHSSYGSSFVPRLAVTKAFGDFNIKFLASRAFKAPTIQELSLSTGSLQQEKATVYQLEAGYRLTDKSLITADVYDITIDSSIVFSLDPYGSESYSNYGSWRTQGLDLIYSLRDSWGSMTLSYSYAVNVHNDVTPYQVPGHDDKILAEPTHKVNLTGSYRISNSLTLSPTVIYIGERYGYYTMSSGGPVSKDFSPVVLANLYFLYRCPQYEDWSVGFGVYNIFNSTDLFIQPFNGYDSPSPGQSREFALKVSYRY